MSALMMGLDNHTMPTQEGENAHPEYKYNKNEMITQIFFQLVRTKDEKSKLDLINKTKEILCNGTMKEVTLLYKVTGYTRDIIAGKGEYELYYMMIMCWYDFNPELSKFLIEKMVYLTKDREQIHPYGSWKDIKFFCQYCYTKTSNKEHPLINYAVSLLVRQLKKDVNEEELSLAGKWCPRESSKKFQWLYRKICMIYYKEYYDTAKDNTSSFLKADKKAKMNLRKVLSKLNHKLDTVQIKQCNKTWQDIDHNKTTSITLNKQTKAFQNVKDGKMRYDDEDRIRCAENFIEFIKSKKDNNQSIKGKRVSIYDFVKMVLQQDCQDKTTIDTINLQWENNKQLNSPLTNFIAMVDTSCSMETENCQPLYNAIGLGIRIAELSKLGKRVLTFSHNPEWINLDNEKTFCDMVTKVKKASWSGNTDIYKAFKLILDVIVNNKIPANEVENMVLVILSDMQIDNNIQNRDQKVLFENIKYMYHITGLQTINIPYTPPHLVFWNLRSTSGFPTSSNDLNSTMMSGCSPVMLNAFCEKGMDYLKNITPIKFLEDILTNERYDCLETECFIHIKEQFKYHQNLFHHNHLE